MDISVKGLREKTEEADYNSILKTTLGGYTKKSVLEYLEMLNAQNSNFRDNCSAEIKKLTEDIKSLNEDVKRFAAENEQIKNEKSALEEKIQLLEEENRSLERDMNEAVEAIRKNPEPEVKTEPCVSICREADDRLEILEREMGEIKTNMKKLSTKKNKNSWRQTRGRMYAWVSDYCLKKKADLLQ